MNDLFNREKFSPSREILQRTCWIMMEEAPGWSAKFNWGSGGGSSCGVKTKEAIWGDLKRKVVADLGSRGCGWSLLIKALMMKSVEAGMIGRRKCWCLRTDGWRSQKEESCGDGDGVALGLLSRVSFGRGEDEGDQRGGRGGSMRLGWWMKIREEKRCCFWWDQNKKERVFLFFSFFLLCCFPVLFLFLHFLFFNLIFSLNFFLFFSFLNFFFFFKSKIK